MNRGRLCLITLCVVARHSPVDALTRHQGPPGIGNGNQAGIDSAFKWPSKQQDVGNGVSALQVKKKIEFGSNDHGGSNAKFTIDKAVCKGGETQQCSLKWGLPLSVRTTLKLKKFNPDDVSQLKGRLLAQNIGLEEPFRSFVLGIPMSFTTRCQVCGGTCLIEYQADNGFYYHNTFPNILDPTMCRVGLEDLKELNFQHMMVPLPSGFGTDQQLNGSMWIQQSLFDSKGGVRFNEDIDIEMVGQPHARMAQGPQWPFKPPTQDSTHPWANMIEWITRGTSHGVFPEELYQTTHVVTKKKSKPLSFREALFKILTGTLLESLQNASSALANVSAEALKETPDPEDPFVREGKRRYINKLTFHTEFDYLENGVAEKNISMTVDDIQCNGKGNPRCWAPVGGRPFLLDANATLKFTMEENSYVRLHCTPSVGGALGKVLKPILRVPPMKIGMCQTDGLTHSIMIFHQEIEYFPPRCGSYELDLVMPTFRMGLDDFSNYKLSDFGITMPPEVPDRFGDFPPAELHCHYDAYHGDGARLASFDSWFGTGY